MRQTISDDNKVERISKVLEKISSVTEGSASIMILERFTYNFPDKRVMQDLKSRYSKLDISPLTIHASKGKEADYVILPTMISGKNGLPSEKVTHPLKEALLPKNQDFEYADERRLFYVALTRAKHRVYLITDMRSPSPFITELICGDEYEIALDEFWLAT